MTKAYNIILVLIFLLPLTLNAQIRFNKVYPDSTETTFSGFIATEDGYIICGDIIKNGYRNIMFIKTDLWGNELWRKYYGKPGEIFYAGIDNCFFKLQQGGFALVGCHVNESDTLYRKTLLMILDDNCDTLFTKTYTIPDRYQYALGGIQTSDKGFAFAGIVNGFLTDTNEINCFLLRADSLGNMMWHQTYGGASTDHAYSVAETADSGFIIGGRTLSFNTGSWPGDWYLVKTDVNGDQDWDVSFGNPYYSDGRIIDLIKTLDGNYIITGEITYYHGNFFDNERGRLIKLNDQKNTIWDIEYSEYVDHHEPYDSSTCRFMGITETKDSLLATICRIQRLDNTEFNKLYVLDSFGDTLFTKLIESPDDSIIFSQEYLNVIECTIEGGYAMAGIATSAFVQNTMWLVKTDSCGFYGEATADFTYSTEEFEVSFCNDSEHADSCIWDFGDGSEYINAALGYNPVYSYADTGNYIVTLEVYNSCYPEVRDTFSVEIHVTDVGIAENRFYSEIKLYPNPADNTVTIESINSKPKEIEIYSMLGKSILRDKFHTTKKTIDCSAFEEGMYVVRLKSSSGSINTKLIISR